MQIPLYPPTPYRGTLSLEKPDLTYPGNPICFHPGVCVYIPVVARITLSLTQRLMDLGTGKVIYIQSMTSEAWHGTVIPQHPCSYHLQRPGAPGAARPCSSQTLLPHTSTHPAWVETNSTRQTKVLLIWHMAAHTPKIACPTNTTAASLPAT